MHAYLALAAAGLAAAAPTLSKRAINDGQILNYALTLEHLEDTFYRTGLSMFSADDFAKAGFPPRARQEISIISQDESTHVSFLTGALTAAKIPAVAACTYDFGLTDVNSFVTTAAILEGVGVSAYLGAAADIMTKGYLTAAGSILTVEARHSAYLRNGLHETPFPQPFDDPLDYNQVYTLAAPFITGCPANNTGDLPALKAFPKLTATACNADANITSGSQLYIATPGSTWPSGTVYAAFITVTGPIWAPVSESNGQWVIIVPQGINGQSYLVLTSNNTAVTDDTTIAGPAIVMVSNY